MFSQAKPIRSHGLCAVGMLLFGALSLRAESAILESVADASSPGGAASSKARELQGPAVMFFGFKTWTTFRWNVDSAELFIHVAKGAAPGAVDIAVMPSPWSETLPPDPPAAAKFVSHKVSSEPEGWLSIRIEPKFAEELTAGKGQGLAIRFKSPISIHARESVAYRPYLIITGGRP